MAKAATAQKSTSIGDNADNDVEVKVLRSTADAFGQVLPIDNEMTANGIEKIIRSTNLGGALELIRAEQAQFAQHGFDERLGIYWAHSAPRGCSPASVRQWRICTVGRS